MADKSRSIPPAISAITTVANDDGDDEPCSSNHHNLFGLPGGLKIDERPVQVVVNVAESIVTRSKRKSIGEAPDNSDDVTTGGRIGGKGRPYRLRRRMDMNYSHFFDDSPAVSDDSYVPGEESTADEEEEEEYNESSSKKSGVRVCRKCNLQFTDADEYYVHFANVHVKNTNGNNERFATLQKIARKIITSPSSKEKNTQIKTSSTIQGSDNVFSNPYNNNLIDQQVGFNQHWPTLMVQQQCGSAVPTMTTLINGVPVPTVLSSVPVHMVSLIRPPPELLRCSTSPSGSNQTSMECG